MVLYSSTKEELEFRDRSFFMSMGELVGFGGGGGGGGTRKKWH